MRRSVLPALVVAGAGVVWPGIGHADDSLRPMMSSRLPVHCYSDASGLRWRVQCDDAARTCLYAPDSELDTRGNRTRPLERARRCSVLAQPFDRARLEADGYRFVQARPDAPHGWTRDNRGRVFQINFDLKKRMYLGGSYAPAKILGIPAASTRSSADFGLLVFEEFTGSKHPNRHRVRLVEGEVFIEPFSAELVLAHYDLSRRYLDPLLRITTFFGKPERHDLHLNVGLWTEAGHLEVHPGMVDTNLWKYAAVQATLDVWQSPRLDSFARVRAGIGYEGMYADDRPTRTAMTPAAAAEVDVVLDDNGFHNLKAELVYETPRYVTPRPGRWDEATRMTAKLRLESVLVAINDQPLSLRLDAGTEKRNDIPGIPYDWAFVANAGLRFSLWAPPRPSS